MNKRGQGFTLIEMMAALVISMVFITPLYIITRDLSSQANAQQKNIHAMQQARTGLALLTEDLRRTGLGASPNPQNDPLSATRNSPNSTAFDRRAVVYMPPEATAPDRFDSIMLVGNFITSRAFSARASGVQLLVDLTGFEAQHTMYCEEQFSPDYAYVHVFGPKNQTIDMKVDTVSYDGGICTVTVESSDRNEVAYTTGDQVWVMANQAVLYRVEKLVESKGTCKEGRYRLVRYYVDYKGGDCDPSSDLLKTANQRTKQVVADYVQDFQVWFRPVTPVTDLNSTRLVLNEDTFENISGSNEVLVPDEDEEYMMPTHDVLGNPEDLSCDQTIVTYGPEHVRSAMVQLSVRTETPEDRLNYQYFMIDPGDVWGASSLIGRDPLYTIAPYLDVEITSQCVDYQPEGAAYQVKTVMTEIMMPNLAARADFLAVD